MTVRTASMWSPRAATSVATSTEDTSAKRSKTRLLVLALVAVDEARRDAVVPQGRVDPARPATRATEDQHPPTLLRHHQLQEQGDLEHVVDLEEPVAQVLGRPRVTPLLDPDRLPQGRPGEISIAAGMVAAEERHLAGLEHAAPRIVHICGRNPMSSMRSPSSITRCRMNARLRTSMSMSSRSRPGVPTGRSTPASIRSRLRLDRRLAPTAVTLTSEPFVRLGFRRDLLCGSGSGRPRAPGRRRGST